uniref:Uncharacterized protein n=1 Tax=Arion vulgaris TaxID=1028688 RepID=A0A0B7A5G3_9EUPU
MRNRRLILPFPVPLQNKLLEDLNNLRETMNFFEHIQVDIWKQTKMKNIYHDDLWNFFLWMQ